MTHKVKSPNLSTIKIDGQKKEICEILAALVEWLSKDATDKKCVNAQKMSQAPCLIYDLSIISLNPCFAKLHIFYR